MVTAITIISLVGAIYFGLVALHEWHLYQQELRMLAVEECELTSQLESKRDTLTDSEAALFQRYQEVERSGAIPAVDSDENAEPTIPSARCPTWDIHEQGKTRQQHSQFGLAQNYAQQQVIR